MNDLNVMSQMLDFIRKSPTGFHAVSALRDMLKDAGFEEWREEQPWEAKRGGKYYAVRGGSSLIALKIPCTEQIKGFHIAASHSDSPSFKVKEAPEMSVEGCYVKLNTEKYGGMILSSWMDRALSVAGRIVEREDEGLSEKLVNLDRDLLVIPNLAIHMNRDMNKGVEYNPQTDMLPLFALTGEAQGEESLLGLIAREAGTERERILGHDLFLYVREPGKVLGANGELILSPRLDDLECVYASAKAFAESEPQEYIGGLAVFDSEEVGSATRQGAGSTFLEDVLVRATEALGMSLSQYRRLVAGSFFISADNAHAVHPCRPEKADPTNRPHLNGGIVIKFHGGQKYATDAWSAARMKELCARAGVPFQTYANRSDIPGGSTLGNISSARVAASCVDIGLPQLAMHSAVETAGAKDVEYCIRALQEFYRE